MSATILHTTEARSDFVFERYAVHSHKKRSRAASPQPTLIGFVQNKAPPFCDPFPPTSIFLVSSPLLLLSKPNGPVTIGSSLNRFPTCIPDYVHDGRVRSHIPLRRMSPTALPSLDRSSAIPLLIYTSIVAHPSILTSVYGPW
jgi:hypothetical protein